MKISQKKLKARWLALRFIPEIEVVRVDIITGEITLKSKLNGATRVFSYEMNLVEIIREIPYLIGGRIYIPQLEKFPQSRKFAQRKLF